MIDHPRTAEILASYPENIRRKLLHIRELIVSISESIEKSGTVEETIKWGEPSYTSIAGSTVRLAWKKQNPNEYGVFFHCQTSLVETFRRIYGDTFCFEGNRAIKFHVTDTIPEDQLRRCIEIALTYHRRKQHADLCAHLDTSELS